MNFAQEVRPKVWCSKCADLLLRPLSQRFGDPKAAEGGTPKTCGEAPKDRPRNRSFHAQRSPKFKWATKVKFQSAG